MTVLLQITCCFPSAGHAMQQQSTLLHNLFCWRWELSPALTKILFGWVGIFCDYVGFGYVKFLFPMAGWHWACQAVGLAAVVRLVGLRASPAPAQAARGGCPARSISWTEAPQPPRAACSSAWPPSLWKMGIKCLNGVSCISVRQPSWSSKGLPQAGAATLRPPRRGRARSAPRAVTWSLLSAAPAPPRSRSRGTHPRCRPPAPAAGSPSAGRDRGSRAAARPAPPAGASTCFILRLSRPARPCSPVARRGGCQGPGGVSGKRVRAAAWPGSARGGTGPALPRRGGRSAGLPLRLEAAAGCASPGPGSGLGSALELDDPS